MSEIQFTRNKQYGTISVAKNGWTKEVCNVTWNQKGPKLDIRDWSPDHGKMSRGITLTKTEAKKLLMVLACIDFEAFEEAPLHPESVMQTRPVFPGVSAERTVVERTESPTEAEIAEGAEVTETEIEVIAESSDVETMDLPEPVCTI